MNKISVTIERQKQEKHTLIDKKYVQRSQLNEAVKFLDSDIIKIISGPRRSGKSVFALLMLRDRNFGYLNFDDVDLSGEVDHDELYKEIIHHYPDSKYIFLDEIQNLKDWELFVQMLQRNGYNLIVTGSNSKLLGKELATRLTGRYIPINLMPFSLLEFLKAKNYISSNVNGHDIVQNLDSLKSWNSYDKDLIKHLTDYFIYGGFPEVATTNIESSAYLSTLFDSIILQDVVNRFSIREPAELSSLAKYLLSNLTKEYSFQRLKNTLGFSSVSTVKSYLSYIEETYLLLSLQRYSLKVQEQINAPRKIYSIDNGFVEAYPVTNLDPKGRLLENLVFIELIRQGYKLNSTLFYYKTRNNKEVDFLVKNKKTEYKVEKLFQVAYDVGDDETVKREIKSLLEASEEVDCDQLYIITWNYDQSRVEKRKTIHFIPIWKFLLFN